MSPGSQVVAGVGERRSIVLGGDRRRRPRLSVKSRTTPGRVEPARAAARRSSARARRGSSSCSGTARRRGSSCGCRSAGTPRPPSPRRRAAARGGTPNSASIACAPCRVVVRSAISVRSGSGVSGGLGTIGAERSTRRHRTREATFGPRRRRGALALLGPQRANVFGRCRSTTSTCDACDEPFEARTAARRGPALPGLRRRRRRGGSTRRSPRRAKFGLRGAAKRDSDARRVEREAPRRSVQGRARRKRGES